MNITIAIDAMSGDHGVAEIVPGTLAFLKKHSDVHCIFSGDEQTLLTTLKDNHATLGEQISIQHAPEIIGMHESPITALRDKKNSSMLSAINLVHSDVAHACVSAGNTGALMAISKFVLKTLPGIERPAICVSLPTLKNSTYLLDAGLNIDASAEKLLQFAMMGTALVNIIEQIESPTVALLNVGTEEIKGNDKIQLASHLLSKSSLNYCGFAEGTDLYTGKFNVIVCDGFMGNIALKTSEGTALMLYQITKNIFNSSLYAKVIGLLAKPLLSKVSQIADPATYNGASLLGLQGVIIKSHGNAKKMAFANAIETAVIEVKNNILKKIASRFY